MAITINGTGTIDGINAGGLNDGVITINEIASATLAGYADVIGINTTASTTSGSTAVTLSAANASIAAGDVVTGIGIAPGTTVSTVSGTSVTLSAAAGITNSANPVTFYTRSKLLTPGDVGGMLCRAWANFSIGAPQTTRSSYNISSITYGGVGFSGLCTITFTSALPDANYVVVVSGSRLSGTVPTVVTFPGNAAPTANGFTLWGFANTTTSIAASGSIEYVSFAVFR